MTDERKELDGLLPGEDLICYSDVEDMLEKIEYYLVNDDEREKIADCGRNKIIGKRTVTESIRQLLEINFEV